MIETEITPNLNARSLRREAPSRVHAVVIRIQMLPQSCVPGMTEELKVGTVGAILIMLNDGNAPRVRGVRASRRRLWEGLSTKPVLLFGSPVA